jgi:hypothetical protein
MAQALRSVFVVMLLLLDREIEVATGGTVPEALRRRFD